MAGEIGGEAAEAAVASAQGFSMARSLARRTQRPVPAWQNWSGSATADPHTLSRPSGVEELASTILHSRGPIRMAGAGHSFTPLVPSQGTIIDMGNFSGLHDHDHARLQARFGAASELGPLALALDRIGQALPNMGDIDNQSFAGALATATHGTGVGLGALHTWLEQVSLVDGRGALRTIDRSTDEDLMLASGVSLGLFGALTEVTVRNVPSYRLRRRRSIVPLDAVLSGFETLMSAHRSAEFFFIPFSGHVMLSTCDLTDAPPTNRPTDDDEAW